MSRFDQALGLARSLAIYHLIPRRQRALRTLYAQFAGPGDLVFDVGAHVGNRTRALAALGCRVIAVEPQPAMAAALRRVVARRAYVEVIEAAVSDRAGRAVLAVSERTPTVSTLAHDWRDARRSEPGFAHVAWNQDVDVETTTLDALAARFGRPVFVKLDIEGHEAAALAGLSAAVRTVSFEFLPEALDAVHACGARLAALGAYRFNWTPAETHRLASDQWRPLDQVIAHLASEGRHGDVYATLEPPRG